MDSKKIYYNESMVYKNGGKLKFEFVGSKAEDMNDYEKIQYLIDTFMKKEKYRNDMVENVQFIKTILNDLKEENLVVSYCNFDECSETVQYVKGKLVQYEYVSPLNTKKKIPFCVKYSLNEGLNFSFKEKKSSIVSYPNSDTVVEQVTNIISHIDTLKEIKPIQLGHDSKILVEIYRSFYGEYPDFTEKNIDVRMQTMMSILVEFGISVNDYDFSLWGKQKIPTSLYLSQQVHHLFPLGKIDDVDNPVSLAEEPKKTIEIVGENIREVIDNEPNSDNILINVSKIIHAARYRLSSNADVEEISKFAQCSEIDVNKSVQLVKRINNKIE